MVRDGVTLTQIGVMFDEEVTTRNEWVGKGADGFPVLEGKVTEVIGQSLIIRYGPLGLCNEASLVRHVAVTAHWLRTTHCIMPGSSVFSSTHLFQASIVHADIL